MWANFRHKKLQTLMIFIIIMLCSMLLTASVSILKSLNEPFYKFAKECDSAAAVVYPYSEKEEDVVLLGKQFEGLKEVRKVGYIKAHYISEDFTFNGKKIESFAKLTEYNNEIFEKSLYLKGNKDMAENLKDNECFLPACISNKYNIKVNDKVKLKLSSGDMVYTVKGIFTDAYNTSTAFECSILINKLPENVSVQRAIRIYGKDEASGKKIEQAYRDKYNGQMNGQIYSLENLINNSLLAVHIVGSVILALGIVMLFVSCLIINFMIRNAMITDAKTIAVYKTIGYTSNDILKMYLIFYFIFVSLASIIGIGCSVFLSDSILTSAFQNMGKVVSNNVVLPGVLCYVLITVFVIGTIYKIVAKTKKVKPVYALNGQVNSSTKKKKEYKGNSKMQFSAFGIALRNILRNKKGAIGIIVTAIVTIFSINFAIIALDTALNMNENNYYWTGTDKSDVIIEVTDSKQYQKVEDIVKKDYRVNYYLNSNIDSKVISMKWKKGMASTAMYALAFDDFSKARMTMIKGRNPEASNEIAISSKEANDLNKNVGDYIEGYVNIDKKVSLLITGIYQSVFEMGNICRVTTSLFTENNCVLDYNSMSVYLKNKSDSKAFINDIKKKIGSSGNVIARPDAFATIMDMIVSPQKSALPPVIALVILVGCVNIFSIVMLKNANSERTNGIYKSLGYTTNHLVLSNLYYVGIIAIVSMAAALPMAVISYPYIMKVSLSMFKLSQFPVSYNALHIILTNLSIILVFIISTFLSSHSLKKVNVRDLVQE